MAPNLYFTEMHREESAVNQESGEESWTKKRRSQRLGEVHKSTSAGQHEERFTYLK